MTELCSPTAQAWNSVMVLALGYLGLTVPYRCEDPHNMDYPPTRWP